MAVPDLSVFIVVHENLAFEHVLLLIDALNQQTDTSFNTFWLKQGGDNQELVQQLKNQARFKWFAFHVDYPVIAGVCCWELTHPLKGLMEHAEWGKYWTYLHMECLPVPDWTSQVLTALAAIEAEAGPKIICMLQQLWCTQGLTELDARHYNTQLCLGERLTWAYRIPFEQYQRYGFSYWEQPWEEDAFVMSTALTQELGLFKAVQKPLYFQDLFDIFPVLSERPYARDIRWFRIPGAIIHHLFHPRVFGEFSPDFLSEIRSYPEYFGHLAFFQAADQGYSYKESKAERLKNEPSPELNSIYHLLRYKKQGTRSLWLEDLDRWHGYPPSISSKPPAVS